MNSHQQKLTTLWNSCREPALRVARAVLKEAGDAEDVLQEAFLKTLRFKGELPAGESAGRAWLLRLVVNLAKDHRLSQQRRRRMEERAGSRVEASRGDRPGQRAEERELRQVLGRALRYLEERFRLPLRLHYLDGLSYGEVAQTLGLSAVTVRVQAHRGTQQLREILLRAGYLSAMVALWVVAWPCLPRFAHSQALAP